MTYRVWGLVLSGCLAGVLWLCAGCAEENKSAQRESQTSGYVERESQISGYVEPESEPEYTEQEREAFRPSVPRIYW